MVDRPITRLGEVETAALDHALKAWRTCHLPYMPWREWDQVRRRHQSWARWSGAVDLDALAAHTAIGLCVFRTVWGSTARNASVRRHVDGVVVGRGEDR